MTTADDDTIQKLKERAIERDKYFWRMEQVIKILAIVAPIAFILILVVKYAS